jgi:alpha-tubulin suppressor-like RCC1 family protein
MNLFVSKASPLGHGSQDSIFKPHRVKFFENMKVERITAGSLFNFAIDDKGRIYYWGCG